MTARLLLLALTFSVLMVMWLEPKEKSRLVQTDYCLITRKAAGYDQSGKLHIGWAKMYGLCSEQDEYRNI